MLYKRGWPLLVGCLFLGTLLGYSSFGTFLYEQLDVNLEVECYHTP